jgi:hypothetical protein
MAAMPDQSDLVDDCMFCEWAYFIVRVVTVTVAADVPGL